MVIHILLFIDNDVFFVIEIKCLILSFLKLYKLNITVNDGYHSNYTEVKIRVRDINDNTPEFSQSEYIVTSIVEEYQPPPGGLFLIQVKFLK